jgi:hypothetical protein
MLLLKLTLDQTLIVFKKNKKIKSKIYNEKKIKTI